MLARYATFLCHNTEFLMKEEISKIFVRLMQSKSMGKFEYFISFPKIFAEALIHLTSDRKCNIPGCGLPPMGYETPNGNVSHLQYLIPNIQVLTHYDLMDLGVDFCESEFNVPHSEIEKCISDILDHTQGPAYRSILDECLKLGKDMVGW